MRSHLVILTAAGMLASILALSPRLRDDSRPGPDRATHEREVVRLRAHFDSVDAELREGDVLRLSPDQKSSRATLIRWLRDYREAGEFPHNDRVQHLAMPFFRDSSGVLCAMAYLIDRSGRGDLVDRVASTRNNAFIAELAADPELGAWLDSVGLSVAEAARIQPTYDGSPGNIDGQGVSGTYAVTSIVTGAAALATMGMNLFSPSTSTGAAGIIAGGLGLFVGAVNLDEIGDTKDVAAANMIIGGAAVAAGVYRLINPRPAGATDGLSQQRAESNAPAISPVVIPSVDGTRLGLAMNARF